jgi:hypothetical protein
MATYLDILDSVAAVIGGTVSANDPHFFSGHAAGDGSGVLAPASDLPFLGCHSLPPDKIAATPVAVLEPDGFTAQLGVLNVEDNVERLRLWVLVGLRDEKRSIRMTVPYRDLIPSAFRAKMNAGRGATGDNTQIAAVFVNGGQIKTIQWADLTYIGWDFTVEVSRSEIPGYVFG